jgi:cytochrome bd-type quinol oxidase subunit 2
MMSQAVPIIHEVLSSNNQFALMLLAMVVVLAVVLAGAGWIVNKLSKVIGDNATANAQIAASLDKVADTVQGFTVLTHDMRQDLITQLNRIEALIITHGRTP